MLKLNTLKFISSFTEKQFRTGSVKGIKKNHRHNPQPITRLKEYRSSMISREIPTMTRQNQIKGTIPGKNSTSNIPLHPSLTKILSDTIP